MRSYKGIVDAVALKEGAVKLAKKFASDMNWTVSKSSPTWFFVSFRPLAFFSPTLELQRQTCQVAAMVQSKGSLKGLGTETRGGQAPRRSLVEAGTAIHRECWSLDRDLWLSTAPGDRRARLQTEQLKTPQTLLLLGHGRVLLRGLAVPGVSTSPFYSS